MPVTITHQDGTTDEVDQLGHRWSMVAGKAWSIEVDVERSQLDGVTLTRKRDLVDVPDASRGVLMDVRSNGAVKTLVVDSPEVLGDLSEPVGIMVRENAADDATVVEELRGDISTDIATVAAGSITAQESDVTYIFEHAHPSAAIRVIEEQSPGEVRYWDDDGTFKLDYTSRRGSDKTASVTLSPSNENVVGDPNVEERSGGVDLTHLRLVAVGEGNAQKYVNVVPSDDSASYDNRVDYTNDDWDDGDTRDWGVYELNDIKRDDMLDVAGPEVMAELKEDQIEVRVTTVDEDIDLGDTVSVDFPSIDVDRDLRIAEWTQTLSGGRTQIEVLLSSRYNTHLREGDDVKHDRVRYNRAFEGSTITETAGPWTDQVDPANGQDWVLEYYYPGEVEHENRAKLHLWGRSLRSFSRGAAAGGDHDHEVTIPDHDHEVTVSVSDSTTSGSRDYDSSFFTDDVDFSNGSTPETETVDLNDGGDSDVMVTVSGRIGNFSDEPGSVTVTLSDGAGGSTIVSGGSNVDSGERWTVGLVADSQDRNNSVLEIEVHARDGVPADEDIENTVANVSGIPSHDHTVSISDTTTETTDDGG
ncbi:MAG: hypothetical protein ACOC42_03765, partial [Halobacteriota archaeon]